MDISRIEPRFIKENQLVGLGFPNQGYVFWKVHGIEDVFYEDYTESPGSVAANAYEDAARLPIDAHSIDNLLRVEHCDHLYQVFMGWMPGATRRYLAYPFEHLRGNLDVKAAYSKAPFGYLTGFESPPDKPSPLTDMWIPKDIDVGFAWWNPLSTADTVQIDMLIRRLKVSVLRDADLVERILKGTQPCKLKSLGGIAGSLDYNAPGKLDVGFINLDATRSEIEAALAQTNGGR
jgi:hypothetical protein